MDALPTFDLLRPTTLDEALKARADHPGSRPLGGGTDLTVNIRRGIVAPHGADRDERDRRAARDQGR